MEVVVAVSIFTIALLGLGAVLVADARSHDAVSESSLAIHALRETAERIRGAPFSEAAVLYQGYTFAVEEIGGVGTVQVFLNEKDTSPQAALLGLPRDLDGDGAAATTNVAATYLLLPVRIAVSWTGVRGPQGLALHLLLAQESN